MKTDIKCLKLAVLSLASLIISGCGANWNSIHREFNLSDGTFGKPESQLIDVKQRSILVYDKEGQTIVCAEPSPDALSVYASAVAAEVEQKSGASASITGSSTESGTAFGLRTQSIQLMRDSYYRACEAYVSDAITKETYDTLIRRLNNQAIAYLAIEQITSSAAKAEQQVITPPNVEELYTKLEAAEKTQKDAAEKKKKLEGEKKGIPATEAEKLKQKQTEIDAAEKERKTAEESVAKLKAEIVAAAKPITVPTKSATPGGTAMSGAVEAARDIALQIIRADYSPQMCFAYFQFHTPGVTDQSVANPELVAYCRNVLTNFTNRTAAYNNMLVALANSVNTNCGTSKKDAEINEACKQSLSVLKEFEKSDLPTMNMLNEQIMGN